MVARRALGWVLAGLLTPMVAVAEPTGAEPPVTPEAAETPPEVAEPAPAEPTEPTEPEGAAPAEPTAPAAAAAAAESPSEEDGWGDGDDEAGWGDEGDDAGFGALPPVPDAAPPPPPRSWSLGGFVRYDLGLWARGLIPDLALAPDHPGQRSAFAKQRASLDLAFRWSDGPWRARAEVHGEYDLAYLSGRDRFDEPTLVTDADGQLAGALNVHDLFRAGVV